jgi:hypothetical protein
MLERPLSTEKIVPSQMLDTPIEDIKDDHTYLLGFARKENLIYPLHIKHSSAAFFDLDAKGEAKYLIFGRQTPFFLKPTTEEGKQYVGGIRNFFHNFTYSKIDNEKKYDFFPEINFIVEKTDVKLTGAEVKQIIERANIAICKNRMFNGLISNCYSASVTSLAYAIEVIANRTEGNAAERAENSRSIIKTRELIAHAIQDNFSIGVKNNSLVTKRLANVDRIIAERQQKVNTPSSDRHPYESIEVSDESNMTKPSLNQTSKL